MSMLRYLVTSHIAKAGPYTIHVDYYWFADENPYSWSLHHGTIMLSQGEAPSLAKAKAAAESDLKLELGWED